MFEHFDNSLGGIKAKQDKKDLFNTKTTTVNLNKITAIEICDAVKIYMKSRIAEYYLLLPAIAVDRLCYYIGQHV